MRFQMTKLPTISMYYMTIHNTNPPKTSHCTQLQHSKSSLPETALSSRIS